MRLPWSRTPSSAPLGLKWRSSPWFVTFVVGLGIAVDLLAYSIIIPVLPFQLDRLGYTRVSSLTGWLLFAFSGGLVLSTIPVAIFSERYNARQYPLLLGIVVLVGSQIMLMEAPTYWLMCIARVLQGIGSAMVWVVGLALICDSTPPEYIGRQLGFAMTGMHLGFLVGPAAGGALYSRFGFRGPFVFSISTCVADFIARLMVIERKDAMRWNHDPAASTRASESSGPASEIASEDVWQARRDAEKQKEERTVTLLGVIRKLGGSSRAVIASTLIFIQGTVYTAQEPSIPLHLLDIWGLNSSKIGLVFLAFIAATLLSGPLAGYLSDQLGSEWVLCGTLLLGLPWWGIIIIEGHLALFIVSLSIEFFFTSGLLTPLTAEMAAVSRGIEGVGYAHIYGAFNVAYGIGNAVGPIVGGQIYDGVKRGWMTLCLVSMGMLVFGLGLAISFIGEESLLKKLSRRLTKGGEGPVIEA